MMQQGNPHLMSLILALSLQYTKDNNNAQQLLLAINYAQPCTLLNAPTQGIENNDGLTGHLLPVFRIFQHLAPSTKPTNR